MAEVTWTACHAADLTPAKGRGLKLLGLDITTAATGDTITTGLTEVSGMSFLVEDAAADANSCSCAFAISGGTITIYVGKYNDYADAASSVRLLVMGVVR